MQRLEKKFVTLSSRRASRYYDAQDVRAVDGGAVDAGGFPRTSAGPRAGARAARCCRLERTARALAVLGAELRSARLARGLEPAHGLRNASAAHRRGRAFR